jgi:NitT/TauT family transport system permease protein
LRKLLGAAATLAAFAALWQAASAAVGRPFLPGPPDAAAALARMAGTAEFWAHARASLSRVALALAASGIPATALGLAAGRSRRLDALISPAIYLFHPVPKAALLPAIFAFFGIGEAARIALVSLIIFGQMLVSARDASRQASADHVDAARSMGAGRAALLLHVVVPAALPGFFTGFRLSLGIAVTVLFVAETFVSESGLGHLVMDAWTRVAFADMYAAIMAMGAMGLALFALTDLAEFALCPWRRAAGKPAE